MSASETFLAAVDSELRKNKIVVSWLDEHPYSKIGSHRAHEKAAEITVAWILDNWCDSANFKAEITWSECQMKLRNAKGNCCVCLGFNGGGKRELDTRRAGKVIPWSDTFDFGKEWFGVPCSDQYWDDICDFYDRSGSSEFRRERPNIVTREIYRMLQQSTFLTFTDKFNSVLNEIGAFYMVVHSKTTKCVRFVAYEDFPRRITGVSRYGKFMGDYDEGTMYFEIARDDRNWCLCTEQEAQTYNITQRQYE